MGLRSDEEYSGRLKGGVSDFCKAFRYSACIETLQLAVSKYRVPEIFNSDQESQFTNREFTDELKKLGIAISMDGRGQCRDNAKMERFWGAEIREYQAQ